MPSLRGVIKAAPHHTWQNMKVSLNTTGDVVVLRGGGYKALGACGIGFIGLLGIAPIASDQVVEKVVGAVVLVCMGVLCWRWVRASVRADRIHLVLKTPFRTITLGWAEIKEARIVPTNGNRLFAILSVTTLDGKTIRVEAVGNRWRRAEGNSGVYQMAAEINRRVAEAQRGSGL